MTSALHELSSALADAGLAPCQTLIDMLGDHPSHCTERRGCGYTQASRFLAPYINQPYDPLDVSEFSIFPDWSRQQGEQLGQAAQRAGWPSGWRRIHEAPEEVLAACPRQPILESLIALPARIESVSGKLRHEESRQYLDMLVGVLARQPLDLPHLQGMPEKPEIGSCSQAEEFFLEIAHGRVRRGGRVNVFLDAAGQPVLLEKIGLGESHSAISTQWLAINHVALPPGSLFALSYPADRPAHGHTKHGALMRLADIHQARFLRLTTLSAEPAWRRRAFAPQVNAQIRSEFLSPCTTTLDDLRAFAKLKLDEAA